MDLEAIAPVGEVRLARVASCGVVREARRGHHGGAGPQQLERRLVADLDPRPRDEGHAAVKVGRLEALLVVELRARGAQRVVEGVQRLVLGLAHVAGPRLQDLARALHLGRARRQHARRRDEDLGLARGPDPGAGEERAVVRLGPASLGRAQRPDEAPLLLEVGVDRAPGGHQQPRPLLVRQLREQRAVAHHRLEHLARPAQVLRPGQAVAPRLGGCAARERASGRSSVLGHPHSLSGFSPASCLGWPPRRCCPPDARGTHPALPSRGGGS